MSSGPGSLFELALNRPSNFFSLTPEEQWDIDKQLDILDWDGECAHGFQPFCDKCRTKWNKKFKKATV